MKLYMIEAAGGKSVFYTWMTASEIIKEIKSVNKKTIFKAFNSAKLGFDLRIES